MLYLLHMMQNAKKNFQKLKESSKIQCVEKQRNRSVQLAELDNKITFLKKDMYVAEKAMDNANQELRFSIQKGVMKKVQEAQSKLNMALEARRRVSTEIETLISKKSKI